MKRVILVLVLVLAGTAAFLYWRSIQTPPLATEIVALQSSQGAEGFARATQARVMKFPDDHGPHLDYQTEWWYYTGNLVATDGRRFGYQLTFFRRGITPGASNGNSSTVEPTRASDWATNQIYFAHFALTDEKNNSHTASEIFSRGAAGLAGASGSPFRVWIENWSAEGLNVDASSVHLRAQDEKIALDLELNSSKPPVVHGENGLSLKTAQVGNASYYVSFTRMSTQGTVTINGELFAVTGTSWFDHEWGTTGLGPNAAGWDWFSIQLDDNREVMFFQIRNKDGSVEPLSSGTLVEANGAPTFLKREDVRVTVENYWTSGSSQGKYPAEWHVEIPSAQIDLKLVPLIADQEMRVSFTYWEGAVNIMGTSNGKAVRGQGYVEMTGYAAQTRGDVGY